MTVSGTARSRVAWPYGPGWFETPAVGLGHGAAARRHRATAARNLTKTSGTYCGFVDNTIASNCTGADVTVAPPYAWRPVTTAAAIGPTIALLADANRAIEVEERPRMAFPAPNLFRKNFCSSTTSRRTSSCFVFRSTSYFHVLTAGDGAEALSILGAKEIGVVLTDERMPGMRGVDLLAKVFERWPDVGRVIVSAYSDADRLLLAMNRGHAHEYVLKPWSIVDLPRVHRSVVGAGRAPARAAA